ncbi:hypothetical protein GPJ56_001869 [Histomonas meleagridis]|uniref:uncharacterized protein n=1 Tax=Histomonas meleagridis TaxID=135588 RepID=UPI00355A9623|nr:hypothetical protein GPJ56_001869 [Histomonas meleagridis]KAH0803192.1 hypothetical protein GO595_003928 [Histomonas meleagridis]
MAYQLTAEEKSQIESEFESEFQKYIQSRDFQNDVDEYRNENLTQDKIAQNADLQKKIAEFNAMKKLIDTANEKINKAKATMENLKAEKQIPDYVSAEALYLSSVSEKMQSDKGIVENNVNGRYQLMDEKFRAVGNDFYQIYQQLITISSYLNVFNEMFGIETRYDLENSYGQDDILQGEVIISVLNQMEENYSQILSAL